MIAPVARGREATQAGLWRCVRGGFAGAVCAFGALGCVPLVWRVSHVAIRGAVGQPLKTTPRSQCEDPDVLSAATVEEGGLPASNVETESMRTRGWG
jgi:hypothetical protein